MTTQTKKNYSPERSEQGLNKASTFRVTGFNDENQNKRIALSATTHPSLRWEAKEGTVFSVGKAPSSAVYGSASLGSSVSSFGRSGVQKSAAHRIGIS